MPKLQRKKIKNKTLHKSDDFAFPIVNSSPSSVAIFQHHQRSGYYISQLIRYSRILESIKHYHLALLDVSVDIRI